MKLFTALTNKIKITINYDNFNDLKKKKVFNKKNYPEETGKFNKNKKNLELTIVSFIVY